MQVLDPEVERKQLVKEYRTLLKALRPNLEQGDKREIREAFAMAVEAHKGMRRKSGEAYIFHPMAVALICAKEIGLGKTAIICALLHDVVEDTDVTLEDIENKFGSTVSNIIDGLTKIAGVVGKTTSIQAENFRKILLTLADDVRVILIKLADRLHNMRTLEAMSRNNQLKIASETMVLFAPLAHRLGLYSIKSELEDLSLKYTEPLVYREISQKLQQTKLQRNKFIRKFIDPIRDSLDALNLTFDIKGRPKSIYSIYNKMKKQNIPFEEVFDLFAIRIIVDSNTEYEKSDCWRIYSIVTDFYTPNPERLRDWISVPKGNGYESLHTTVMGPQGRWVEVQIRSTRMDDVAEKGYAAHWKYKEDTSSGLDNNLEEWIKKIRELLENPESNAIDFIDDFKLNLFSDEVFIFTPKGDMITLPAMSTALDFAFDIHTQVGEHCLGAKVNHRLVPLSYRLKNGDQVEIITSKKQKPHEDWLNYVVTAKAKSRIKASLKDEKRKIAQEGKEYLIKKFKHVHLGLNNQSVQRLVHYFKLRTHIDLYYNIGIGAIDKNEVNAALKLFESTAKLGHNGIKPTRAVNGKKVEAKTPDIVVVGEDLDLNYSFAKCCNAIPGDDIFGFVTINDGIKIHRTNCPNGIRLMSNYGYRIIRAKWASDQMKEIRTFPVGIKLTGIDSIGIVSNITDIISKELQVNIQSITVSSIAGAFEGSIILYIYDTAHLEKLIEKIKEIKGIEQVMRFQVEDTLSVNSEQ